MKAQVLLLGEYDSSSLFKLYLIPTKENNDNNAIIDYLCIEDLYYLFFQHSDKQIYPLFQHLYQLYPHHFYLDNQLKKCYIAKHHVLTIAKSLQLLALAEFCSLSHDELLNNVADPLFAITNALLLRPVPPKYMDIFLDWSFLSNNASLSYFYSPSSSNNNVNNNNNNNNNAAATSCFISDHPKQQQQQNNNTDTNPNNNNNIMNTIIMNTNTNNINTDNNNNSNNNNNHTTTVNTINTNITNNNNNMKNDSSWTCHFLPIPSHLLKRTLQAQKQQHAIIECRQRQLVFRQSHQQHHHLLLNPHLSSSSSSTSKINNHHRQQQPIIERKRKRSSPPLCSTSPPPSSISCSSSSSISSSSTITTTIHHHHNHHNQHQLPSVLSPSSHHHHHHHHHHHPPLPPPLLINSNNKEDDDHHLLLKKKQKLLSSSYNNNLDLLATQATKMKGLPLSPEISPQPPVLSLPPISSNVSFHSSPLIQSISLPSLRNVLSDI